MKVIDLYKQLEILINSGQENLSVMISTSSEYTPLEVVDIHEGECWLCDTWTPVFDDDKTVKQQDPPHIGSTGKNKKFVTDENGVVYKEMNEQNIKDIREIFEKNGIEFNIRKIYKHTPDGEKIEVYTNENPRKKGKIQ